MAIRQRLLWAATCTALIAFTAPAGAQIDIFAEPGPEDLSPNTYSDSSSGSVAGEILLDDTGAPILSEPAVLTDSPSSQPSSPGQPSDTAGPTADELYAAQLLGEDLSDEAFGQPVSPQGLSGATAFTPLTKDQIASSREGVYFIDSSDGTYHPELAKCSLDQSTGGPVYDCDHIAAGQFSVQMVAPGQAVLTQKAAGFSAGSGSYQSRSSQASARTGFSFNPYVAVRGIYSLGTTLAGDPDNATDETQPSNGYGGTIAVGSELFRSGKISIRAEAEAGYRTYEVPGYDADPEPGTMDTLTAMANVYAEFDVTEQIFGYVGGGVGGAQTTFTDVLVGGQYTGNTPISGSGWSLAYQGMVGAGFKLSPTITAFAEYRRLQIQKAINSEWAGYDNSWGANEVGAGVRISLGGSANRL